MRGSSVAPDGSGDALHSSGDGLICREHASECSGDDGNSGEGETPGTDSCGKDRAGCGKGRPLISADTIGGGEDTPSCGRGKEEDDTSCTGSDSTTAFLLWSAGAASSSASGSAASMS